MKRLQLILALILIFFAINAYAANKMYWAIGLTGTTGTLDSFDGGSLADGDGAMVVSNESGEYKFYPYRLVATCPSTELSPFYIVPNTNAGTKCWVLTALYGSDVNSARDDNQHCIYMAEASSDGDNYTKICTPAKGTGYANNGDILIPNPSSATFNTTCTVNLTGNTNTLTTEQSYCSYINVTSVTAAATVNITTPIPGKVYTVYKDSTSYALTLKVTGQTGGAVSAANHYGSFTTTATDTHLLATW